MKSKFKILILAAMALCLNGLRGQQTTIDLASGKLRLIQVNEVEIMGHDGNQVEISVDLDHDDEELAEGLRIISPSGMMDNTGIGLHMTREGNEVTLEQISQNFDETYYIKVPRNLAIYYEHDTHHGDDLMVRDLTGEIEISAGYNDVILDNITGPCSVSSMHGEIRASFSSINQSNPISLYCAHDEVHVSVPADAKATFHLSSSYGTMYSDLDLEIENQDGSNLRNISNRKVVGKLNGGGVNFTIEATHDNIYLRKN
jgi:hypothetical protein